MGGPPALQTSESQLKRQVHLANVEEVAIRVRVESLTGRKVTIPHHASDIAEGTLRAILREVGGPCPPPFDSAQGKRRTRGFSV